MSFNFEGELDISKSWMNRALILQSLYNSFDERSLLSSLEIRGESSADDVVYLKKALDDLKQKKSEFYAGLGGTTLRFLALRLSREVGEFKLFAEKKLLQRPQTEISETLNQLGVICYHNEDHLLLKSQGWNIQHENLNKGLFVKTDKSSQFISAVILNSLYLPRQLSVVPSKQIISESYLNYTLSMMSQCGVEISYKDSYQIKQNSKIETHELVGEVDISSFFALASAAVLAGHVHLRNWSDQSQQPDKLFVTIFKDMNIHFEIKEKSFKVAQQNNFNGVKVNLSNSPDLFPVLSVVCAFAEGESELFGAAQLGYKESHRIKKTYELLSRCGFAVIEKSDGMIIKGHPNLKYKKKDLIYFDPDHDHRMAFAAALLKLKGFPIVITDPLVINKSYPQFYQHIGFSL